MASALRARPARRPPAVGRRSGRSRGCPRESPHRPAHVAALADPLHRGDDLGAVGEVARGRARVADAARGAGGDDVARVEREDLRQVDHEVHRAEHELIGRGVLHGLAGQLRGDPQCATGGRVGGQLVGGDQHRSERRGVLPGLALQELLGAPLVVAHRHVVEHGVPGDGGRRRLAVGTPDRTPDDDGQLGLVVHPVGLLGQLDLVVRADERGRELAEDRGVLGQLVAHLEHVVAVVQPDTDDLLGRRHQRRVVQAGGLVHRARRARGVLGPVGALQQRPHVGLPRLDGGVAVDAHRPVPGRGPDRREPHRAGASRYRLPSGGESAPPGTRRTDRGWVTARPGRWTARTHPYGRHRRRTATRVPPARRRGRPPSRDHTPAGAAGDTDPGRRPGGRVRSRRRPRRHRRAPAGRRTPRAAPARRPPVPRPGPRRRPATPARGCRAGRCDAPPGEQVGRGRDRVRGEAGGQRLALVVEQDLLVQRLRDALGETAVLLALDEQRVQDPPAVVDGDVAQRGDPPGVGVDLDHRQVRPEREGRPVLRGVEPDVQLLPRGGGLAVHVAPGRGRAAGHPGDAEGALVGDLDVLRGGLQQVRGELAGPLVQLVRGLGHRGPAELQRPRAAGPGAARDERGVGLDVADPVHRDAEPVRHQHRERRRVPLTVRRGAGRHRRRAVVVHGHRAVLAAPAPGGDLDVDRDADAQAHRVVVLATARLLLAQLVVAGHPQRLAQRQVVVADVVAGTGRGGVREDVGREQVAPAQLDRVDAQLGGRDVDQPLQVGGGLRASRAAEGAHRGGVGQCGDGVVAQVRDVVDAGRHEVGGAQRERAAEAGVGPGVPDHPHAQAGHPAVAGQPQLVVGDLAAAVRHRDEVLGPGLDPGQRPAQRPGGGDGHGGVLGEHPGLGAEPAADVRGDHPDLVGLQPGQSGELGAEAVRHLGGDVHGEREVGGGGVRDDRVALHRDGRDALVHHPRADDDLGAVERVAGPPLAGGQVAALVGELQRGVVGERGLDVGDRGQRVVVDLDELGGVDGGGAALGDDQRHRLADEPHPVGRQRRARQRGVEDHQAVVGGQVEVGRGVHGEDAGRGRGLGGVDAGEQRVRHRRADERHVGQARRCVGTVDQVADEGARTGDQVGVLDAADGGSQDRARHVAHTTALTGGSSG
ncbi:hypothetical protein L7F22_000095 [Adiantum nelumboides]|nr:hypothetical protein [Adiantum nelumboides]